MSDLRDERKEERKGSIDGDATIYSDGLRLCLNATNDYTLGG